MSEEQLKEAQEYLKKLEENAEIDKRQLDAAINSTNSTVPKSKIKKLAELQTNMALFDYTDQNKKQKCLEEFNELKTKYPDVMNLDNIITTAQDYGMILFDIEEQKEYIEKLKKKNKQEKSAQIDKELADQNIDVKGHLFPVKLVYSWTQELKKYDKQLDEYIEELLSIERDVDVTLLCKWAERACRRINYLLALLRHKIVKALSAHWMEIMIFMELLKVVVNFNPTDIGGACSWIKNVIGIFMGPYKKIIDFIIDFQTYIPPLVQTATGMVAKVMALPVQMLETINLVATDKDGNVKPIAEIYKEYLQIDFKPITLNDIMSGPDGETPTYMSCLVDKKQNEALKSEVDVAKEEMWNIIKEFSQEINQLPDDKTPLCVAWPACANLLARRYYATSPDFDTTDRETDCLAQSYVAVKCFGKKAEMHMPLKVDVDTSLNPGGNLDDPLLGGSGSGSLLGPSTPTIDPEHPFGDSDKKEEEKFDPVFNKAYSDKQVNNTLHKYYPVFNFKEIFVDYIGNGLDVGIIDYYVSKYKTINWGTGKPIKKTKIDSWDMASKNIFDKYSQDLPQIEPMLFKLELACIKYVTAKEKQLADAKVSAFK